MFELPIWSMWLGAGVILLICEMFTMTFFLLCFGVGALVTAPLTYLGVSSSTQWVVFLVVSAVCVFYTRRFAERVSSREPERKSNVDRHIGHEGPVIEAIDKTKGTGRITVSNEEWRARTENGEMIAVGENVLVTGVQGTHLIVKKQ